MISRLGFPLLLAKMRQKGSHTLIVGTITLKFDRHREGVGGSALPADSGRELDTASQLFGTKRDGRTKRSFCSHMVTDAALQQTQPRLSVGIVGKPSDHRLIIRDDSAPHLECEDIAQEPMRFGRNRLDHNRLSQHCLGIVQLTGLDQSFRAGQEKCKIVRKHFESVANYRMCLVEPLLRSIKPCKLKVL